MEPLFYVDLDGGDDVCTGCAAMLALNLCPQYELEDWSDIVECGECGEIIWEGYTIDTPEQLWGV